MKFRRQRTDEDSVNLTPLIDVVFLLLIFFMVSTTFTKETHLTVTLPESSGELQPQVQEPLIVVIGADGRYGINGKGLVNSKASTLRLALEEIAGGNRQQALIITADAKTPHQSVVTAMDVAGQLGFVNLSITTQAPGES
ncbi:biopolymer transporter ExbD [uncultured Pseudoteredinibacter sp.]|uniref:ExbD/TolR family protein n=1 Tax=uncultured Pseudoteredinibacter sp. TaxID=1641701 RepID=UPI002613AA9A|nr:biopolymer transporter ExbD [uncultured Pseudoteredinibacter sp.]